MGSARGFRKVVIVCTVFNNLRPMCFQICAHKSVTQSQCIAWNVAVVWHDRLSVDVLVVVDARDLLTTLIIGSSLLWEMMLWLRVSVI